MDELIFPGFIDLYVHAHEDMSHTQEYKETFLTAGELPLLICRTILLRRLMMKVTKLKII